MILSRKRPVKKAEPALSALRPSVQGYRLLVSTFLPQTGKATPESGPLLASLKGRINPLSQPVFLLQFVRAVLAARPPFSAYGRERPNAGISGEKRRRGERERPRRGGAGRAVVHRCGQMRMRLERPRRQLSAECAMAEMYQRWGRDEFETYDWWGMLKPNIRP